MFYRIVIASIFWIAGYTDFSIGSLIKALIPVRTVGDGFTSAFIMFYLFIPFLNVLVKNMNERQHIRLLILCGFTFVFLETMPKFSITFSYVSWFIVIYFISSYIRLYPKAIFDNVKVWTALLVLFTIASVASIFVCLKILNSPFYLLANSNKILAVVEAICAFMFFKNLKIKNSKFINVVASATFGVLLIHANSDAMRSWLWGDLLDVVGNHSNSNAYLHIVISVLGVYVVCTIIDLIRIYLLEKTFFKFYDKITINLNDKYLNFENKICNKFNIK